MSDIDWKEKRNEEYRALINRDGTKCHYCFTEMSHRSGEYKNSMSREHIVPTSLGGPSHMLNMILACHQCNNGHGSRMFKCYCEFCYNARMKFRWNDKFMARITVKPRVYKQYGKWFVDIGSAKWACGSWRDAHKTLFLGS